MHLTGELDEVSVSQVQQCLASGGGQSTTYFAVGSALRALAKEGKLGVARDGHRLQYHMRTAADGMPATPPLPGATYAPRTRRVLPYRADVVRTPLEEVVLEVNGKLGRANLDLLYRTLARPLDASYPEFVLVVRGLVQKGLVIRVQERGRYFYQVRK